MINFSLAPYQNDTWMGFLFISSVYNLVISYYEISITIVINGYYQVPNYINKILSKKVLPLHPLKPLFQKLFALALRRKQLFKIIVIRM